MAVKKRRPRGTKKGQDSIKLILGVREEIAERAKELNDRYVLADLECRHLKLEKEYNNLREKLVGLLLPEQVDAAHTCGVTPEVYALEWIDIFLKKELREKAEAFGMSEDCYSKNVRTLRS